MNQLLDRYNKLLFSKELIFNKSFFDRYKANFAHLYYNRLLDYKDWFIIDEMLHQAEEHYSNIEFRKHVRVIK